MGDEPILHLRGVNKSFGPVHVLRDVDFEDAWDQQIDQDANAGRLDKAWQAALEDIKAGRTKPLDQFLDNP